MASSSSWMPSVNGRHEVAVGPSFARAAKVRRGLEAKPGKRPTNNFYTYRYNFKPESVDPYQPGSLQILSKTKESTVVKLERESTQVGEGHVFKGTEFPTKEVDCVLIYNEETGAFVLEKVESIMSLNYERKTTKYRPSQSPAPSPPTFDIGAHLEHELGMLQANGSERGASPEERPSPSWPVSPLEEKPRKPVPRPKAVPKRAARPEEEDLEFGYPPPKRSRSHSPSENLALPDVFKQSRSISPLPPTPRKQSPGLSLPKVRSASPEGLSLPGMAPASSYSALELPGGSAVTPSLYSAVPSPAVAASDSGEEWDEVPVAVAPPAPSGVIVIDQDDDVVEENEDNFLDFELLDDVEPEVEAEAESEEEDFLAGTMSPAADNDDYSSSESDE